MTDNPTCIPPLLTGDDERRKMGRPTYPQTHPAMANARNIVNQILDEAGTDVATRQRINDDCDQFVAWMLEGYATAVGPHCSSEDPSGQRCILGSGHRGEHYTVRGTSAWSWRQ